MNSYFSTFLCTGVLYTMMIKKKRITAALLALGLGAVTMFSQFPVSAAEETAQDTDAAAQTADPSVVVTNGIDGWPQASDISSAAAIVMETSTNTVLYSKNADQPLYPASAKPLAALIALMTASVPEFTSLSISIDGKCFFISSAKVISPLWQAPKVSPLSQAAFTAFITGSQQ